jgi:hypothetical protein
VFAQRRRVRVSRPTGLALARTPRNGQDKPERVLEASIATKAMSM